MDLRQIKNLMKEFEDSKIHKLEIKDQDFSIRLEKEDRIIPSITPITDLARQPLSVEVAAPSQEVVEVNNNIEVKAPIVGTYYNAPSPDSEPFVQLNKHVNKGDVLFIVEAMKVMNEIMSPVSGKIVKINTKDASMVEFGEVIMEIEE